MYGGRIAQQVLAEPLDLDAEIVLLHHPSFEPGVAREPLCNGAAFVRGKRRALRERRRVRAAGPGLDFAERGPEIPLQVGGEALVVPRRRGVGRQVEHIGQVVARGEPGRLEVEDRRDEQYAVEGDPPFEQMLREPGGARGAIALSHHEQR